MVWINSFQLRRLGMYFFTFPDYLLMRSVAQKICDKMPDYHSFNGFKFTPDHVLEWANQFADDRDFILEEFLHLLNQGIYLSENDVRQILINKIKGLATEYEGGNAAAFLHNAEFLNLQQPQKSQGVLLKVLDEEITKTFGIRLADCKTQSKKYAVYLDDVLASGKTIIKTLPQWLNQVNEAGEKNLESIKQKRTTLIISTLCKHEWGADRMKFILGKEVKYDELGKRIRFSNHYVIENHPSWRGKIGQKFNCALPVVENQPQSVLGYFSTPHASSYLDIAKDKGQFTYRSTAIPAQETFFSSPENRIRFENILLHKGIELLNKTKNLAFSHRPLGMINPSYKTFGTGTLFFTWQNISNTTPIVFWWDVPGSNWFPLFKLLHRGSN